VNPEAARVHISIVMSVPGMGPSSNRAAITVWPFPRKVTIRLAPALCKRLAHGRPTGVVILTSVVGEGVSFGKLEAIDM